MLRNISDSSDVYDMQMTRSALNALEWNESPAPDAFLESAYEDANGAVQDYMDYDDDEIETLMAMNDEIANYGDDTWDEGL